MNTTTINKVDQILIPCTAYTEARQRVDRHFEASKTCSEPVCLAIIGESRSGKSRVLDDLMLRHPMERRREGLHIPILRISTPSNPTVKGLVSELLHRIGEPSWNKRASEIEKTKQLVVLLKSTGTTMIIIDEFQHFQDKASRKIQHHVADWLKNLVEECKVALVVAGLPRCTAVISQNPQLSGRFTRAVSMPRYDWANPHEQAEFLGILQGFHLAMQECELPDMSSMNMAFRFYCATGGLIGYVVKILRQAHWDAYFGGRSLITLEHLALAFKDALWDVPTKLSVNPFSLGFDPTPSPVLLDQAKQVGTEEEEALPSRHVTRSRPTSAHQALAH